MTTVGIATGAGRGMGLACAERLAEMVDVLLLVDQDGDAATDAAKTVSQERRRARVEAVPLDVTDKGGLERLAFHVPELGTLRAVAHAAGVSPTMADWRRVLTVDLIGTAMLAETLRPLATAGTAMVFFASMSPQLAFTESHIAADAVLDDPLDDRFLDRLHDAVGGDLEHSGVGYAWAKRGVQRLAQREAARLGAVGARVCSVSPGIIDTPMGRQEAAQQPVMKDLVDRTPLGRIGRAAEVAAVVAFLLSDEAGFVNGVDVLVDGGLVAAIRQPGA